MKFIFDYDGFSGEARSDVVTPDLPPLSRGYRPAEMIRIIGRLCSTASGANYHWTGNVLPVNASPYEPFIDLIWQDAQVKVGEWHGDAPQRARDYYLSQGGTLIDAPWTIESSRPPVDVTARDFREEVINQIWHSAFSGVNVWEFARHQGGHLEFVTGLLRRIATDGTETVQRQPRRPVALFDHEFYFGGKFRVIRAGNRMVAWPAVPVQDDGAWIWIVHPHHEPVRLVLYSGEMVLFEHPWPQGMDAD